MNFIDFFRIYFDFSTDLFLFKKAKKGVYYHAGPARVRRDMQGQVAELGEPT